MERVREGTAGAFHAGVNAQLLSMAESYRSAGISWYIQNLLRHLPEVDPEIRFTVFLGEKRYPGVPGLQIQTTRLPTQRPMVRIFWEQAIQPWALLRAGVDLVHAMALVGPVLSRRPLVVTVHDLSFLTYPESFQALKRLYLKLFTRLSVRRARRVIAISENTKLDVVQQYGISPAKVDMIHYGLDSIFKVLAPEEVASFRDSRGLPSHFILFVGTLEPRKNIVRLIEAYAQMPKDRPPLMLVGGKGWLYGEIYARVEALDLVNEVHFVGHVPGNELPLWYNAADLFVYPSLYEGFGLPPLEAMACGTPVVTANAASLPEVVGQAGMLVDPGDSGELSAAMIQVTADRNIQDEMRTAGLAQAATFSWQKAARRTVECYRQALVGREGPVMGGEQRV